MGTQDIGGCRPGSLAPKRRSFHTPLANEDREAQRRKVTK